MPRLTRFGCVHNDDSAGNTSAGAAYFNSFYVREVAYPRVFRAFVAVSGTTGINYRIAFYKGGQSDDLITGAELLWQSEQLHVTGQGASRWIHTPIPRLFKLVPNERYWVVFHNDSTTVIQRAETYIRDFNTGLFFWADAGYSENGFPRIAPANGGTQNASHAMKAYFEYESRAPRIALADVPTDVRFAKVKKPWTTQPPPGTPIDWTHPLAKGLVNFISLSQGVVYDHANRRQHPIDVSGSDYEIAARNKFGSVLHRHSDVNNTHYAVINADESSDFITEKVYSAMTLSFWVAVDNQTVSFDRLVANPSDAGATPSFGLLTATGWAYQIVIHGENWNTTNTFSANTGTFKNDGLMHCYSNSWNKSVDSGQMRFFIDGDYLQNSSVGKTDNSDPTQSSFINQFTLFTERNDGSASTYQTTGEFGLFVMHDRDLTAAEHKSLAENPWQIFQAQEVFAPINEALPDLARFNRDWEPPQ